MARQAVHLKSEISQEFTPSWSPWETGQPRTTFTNLSPVGIRTFRPKTCPSEALANLRLDFLTIWRQDGTLLARQNDQARLDWDKIAPEQIYAAIRENSLVPQPAL